MFCHGVDHKVSRRRLMFGGGKAAAYFALAARGDAETTALNVKPRNTAKTVIFVNMSGTPSQLDTFDAKDGPWNADDADIQQLGKGMFLSRTLFPEFSKLSNDLLLLHSVQSWEAAHERGAFYVQTSHPQNPAFISESPHIGSVVAMEKGAPGPLPPFLALNTSGTLFQGSKFMGGVNEPMLAPASANGLTTLEHNYYAAASQSRFEEKFKMLLALDDNLRKNPLGKEMASHADFYDAAKRLMYNQTISNVFKFSTDENNRYGNTNFGRACIVARNAIKAKAGVSFINLHSFGWDTHQFMYDTNYAPNMYTLCNDLDRGIGNLVQDLKASGDFDKTLIVMMGEFGRTPGSLNPRGGRDHHKFLQAAAMMGGGIKGGRAIGESDKDGAQVITPGWSMNRPIFMEDIASTIYSALGINWTKSIAETPSGRKFEYVPYAVQGTYSSIDEVFG